MKIPIAVYDKVVIEILPETDVTEGGIVMPETAVKSPQLKGKVLSIGNKVDIPTLKEGDIILCHPNAGMAIMVERTIMKVLKFDEIYAVMPGD